MATIPLRREPSENKKYRYRPLDASQNPANSAEKLFIYPPSRPVKHRKTEPARKPLQRHGHKAPPPKTTPQKPAISKAKSQNKLMERMDLNPPVDREPRYVAHWRIAIVYEDDEKNEIFHGRTYEVSLKGASIFSDHNIFFTGRVTILLAVPWYRGKQKEKIIEIKGRMVYTILSSDGHQFRIGLQFLSFKEGEERYIAVGLQDRRLITAAPY